MKKLLILTFALLVSLSILGRPKENLRFLDARITYNILDELRNAGYTILPEVVVTAYRNPQDTIKPQLKKQRYEEFDDLYYQPKKDGNHGKMTEAKLKKIINKQNQKDSLLFDALKKPDLTINNYYNNDPFFYSNHLGRFYHGGFNYWYYNDPFYYNPWFYDDFWFGWNYPYRYYSPYYYNNFYFGYGWNTWNFGLSWNWHYPYSYYPHYNNNFYTGNHGFMPRQNDFRKPDIGRRDRPSTMSNYVEKRPQVKPEQRRENMNPQDRMRNNLQSKPKYSESRRTYTPSYDKPRMEVRPPFNNSKTENRGMGMQNMEQRRGNMENMPSEQRNNMMQQNRREIMNTNREIPSQRSYTPSQNSRRYDLPNNSGSSRNFNEPTRNFNSQSNMNRSSNYTNSYNSGGGSIRNSVGSGSSGTSNNSGGTSATRR